MDKLRVQVQCWELEIGASDRVLGYGLGDKIGIAVRALGPLFHEFFTPHLKKNADSCWSCLRHTGSLPTSVINCLLFPAICE